MPLIEHPTGNYRFLPGIAPYSCGVVASPGYEIVHVSLRRPLPYRAGFEHIDERLKREKRPRAALCGIELRSPRPFTFEGFAAFNAEYARILQDWGVFVDGVNPVARTNVAPALGAPDEPILHGYSFTQPCEPNPVPTFVVAGAGELPEGVLNREGIIRVGETDPDAIFAKAQYVMGLMEARLKGLGADWNHVTVMDVYTVHSMDRILPEVVLFQAGLAAKHGAQWYYSRPPIFEIEYEMDMRGVARELYE
ncbi:MAG: hypothetical protein ABS79_05770 [Planctomycetes bacterium SCN 63-9]|nr:MAG: hypothetical protein ABS79_05770 [Planctomycetes bacterium SCN 63-9]